MRKPTSVQNARNLYGSGEAVKLAAKARWVRREALEMCVWAGKGHLGGAFSVTDILVSIYYTGLFRVSPQWLGKSGRDRIIFSKGHAALALYPILGDLGFFPVGKLKEYGEDGGMLGGHPDHFIPGVEISSGSLGHGLSIAAGLALSGRLSSKDYLSIAVLGDGECNEGSVWEAAMFGSQQELGRLIAIIDNNGVGATDFTARYLGPEPMAGRWRAFGWQTVEVDGHNFQEITAVLRDLRHRPERGKPLAIIAKTVKGRGVPFMENDPRWHHGVPKGELLEQARRLLSTEQTLY